MNDVSRDESEEMSLFAPVRDFKASPDLARRLDAGLHEFRSQVREGTVSASAGTASKPHAHRVKTLPRLAVMIGGGGSLVAAIVLMVILLAPGGNTPAWAQVAARVRSMDWIHFDGVSRTDEKVEWWVGLENRTLAVKEEGMVFFDDTDSRVRLLYYPEKNVIEKRKLADTSGVYLGFTRVFDAMRDGDNLAGMKPRKGPRRIVVKQDVREVMVEGKRFLEFEFVFDDPEGAIGAGKSVYRVNPNTKLPVQLKKWLDLGDDAHATYEIDYPSMGPIDIYALGVPRETPMVDAASE